MCKKINYENLCFDITSMALKAMLYEVSCFPSPGLVSPVSNGAHKDMNFYTFIDSTVALNKYIYLFCKEGFSSKSPKELFNEIRKIGLEAEKAMFKSTSGVNTHKGMLFSIGICSAAITNIIYNKGSFSDISSLIKQMCEGLTEELVNLDINKKLSNGEKLYKKYKIKGIRGEVEAGMPLAFDLGLKTYKESFDLNENDRVVNTLITIMQQCEDSTIIHRHNPEILYEVQEISKKIVSSGAMKSTLGKKLISELNEEFISRNISPGGSADVLAITIFLYEVEKYMNNINQ